MYYFNPNDYAPTYHVLANSKEEALVFLKVYKNVELPQLNTFDLKQFEKWDESTINLLPDNYTLEEFEVGKISEGEIS